MKILHLLNSREYTGAEKVACQLINAFRKRPGYDPVYCSPYSDNVEQMVTAQGIRYVSVTALTLKELSAVLRTEQPDVIHAHDMRAGFMACLCCGSIPVISHIHNNAYDARGISPKSVAYILAGCRAKEIVWVSRSSYLGYAFHSLFRGKSRVLYNVIDTEEIFRKLSEDTDSYGYDLIYVGRLTYQKDPQRLIRLCARIREQKPDFKAAIVGAGELESECKALAAELGLNDTVQFLGFRSNPMKMIADSKAMILTSRWEGTPMCALEAMALGTPVISTPSDGMADLIENNVSGYLSERDDDLAAAVLRTVTDEAYRAAVSQGARERFCAINDEAQYVKTFADIYERWVKHL